MENGRIDLHLHTTASDGTFSPVEVVTKALEIGLKVISITDHDTVNGITEAIKHIDKLRQTNIDSIHLSSVSQKEFPALGDANIHPFPMEIIPGVELSSTFKHKEVHILGYFIDYKDSKLLEQLENLGGNLNEIESGNQKNYSFNGYYLFIYFYLKRWFLIRLWSREGLCL